MKNIDELVSEIKNKFSTRKKIIDNFPKFIYSIRFPRYKNLEKNTNINFKHPFTVLVGQNGCGKSSVLHALYGSPRNHSVRDFWFSTKLDPIEEGNGGPNCLIYSYYNSDAKEIVEIIKTRSQFKKKIRGKEKVDPDYWEPRRISKTYGMETPDLEAPGSEKSSRWRVPEIKVVYLDFRSELSAFDQYKYFGDKPNTIRYKRKEDRLRSWTKSRLAPLLTKEKKHIYSKGKKKLNKQPPVDLTDKEVKVISHILGKEYLECTMLEHQCFGFEGYSVRFTQQNRCYTEAFAGSGEMAVVRVVYSVMRTERNSLILLDEPEVSLHPGAQKKLRDFLFDQISNCGHQIVICSHSPVFLENIPKECIKVFSPNISGSFRVAEDVDVSDAFVQIGHTISSKTNIIVEDSASQLLVEKCLDILGQEFTEIFEVSFMPGGESSIFKDLVVYSRNKDRSKFVIFDGDIYKKPWPRNVDIAESEIDSTIEELCGQSVDKLAFRYDGGTDKDREIQKTSTKREFLEHISKKCFFLPAETPEEIIWNASSIAEKTNYETGVCNSDKNRFKTYIGKFAKDQCGSDSSTDRKTIMKIMLNKYLNRNDPLVESTLDIIKSIKKNLQQHGHPL